MSTEFKLPTGTPAISFADATEFFAQRKVGNCPSCNYNRWSIFTSTDKEGGGTGAGFAAVELNDFSTSVVGMPVILATCKRCAFTRVHSMLSISQWVADGKPEFNGDE